MSSPRPAPTGAPGPPATEAPWAGAPGVFFVGGAVKSGTTWLQHLLDGHPEIACRGEGHFGARLLPALQRALADYNAELSSFNGGLFQETAGFPLFGDDDLLQLQRAAASLLLRRVAGGRPVRLVGEKTPRNVLHIAELRRLFPGAPLVQIVRDGRDACVSNWHQQLRMNPAHLEQQFGGDMVRYAGHFAGVWRDLNLRGLQGTGGGPHVLVRYEDLHTSPVAELRKVFRSLGVRDDDEAVSAALQAGAFERLSGGRPPGEADPRSFFRKGVVGDWRGTLSPAAQAAFEAVGGPLLEALRYPVGSAARGAP